MELTTKAEPILGEFKGLRRLLWSAHFGVMCNKYFNLSR